MLIVALAAGLLAQFFSCCAFAVRSFSKVSATPVCVVVICDVDENTCVCMCVCVCVCVCVCFTDSHSNITDHQDVPADAIPPLRDLDIVDANKFLYRES